MQPPAPVANTARPTPAVVPDVIKVTARSSRGDGSRLFTVEVPACGAIASVKQLLCLPPHSMHVCSDASTLVLVLKGKGAAVACALQLQPCDFVDVIRV
jgi:hypothetical protein